MLIAHLNSKSSTEMNSKKAYALFNVTTFIVNDVFLTMILYLHDRKKGYRVSIHDTKSEHVQQKTQF